MRVRSLAPAPALALGAIVALAAPVGAAQQQPSPSPTGPLACPAAGSYVRVQQPSTIDSGKQIAVSIRVVGPSATYTVTLTRQDPSPVAVVRSTTVNRGTPTIFTFRLGQTHRFRGTASSSEPCFRDSPVSFGFVVPVRAAVSLAATRTSSHSYAFTGRVQPASGTVSLYRVGTTGGRVLTSRANVNGDGTYRIDRRFTGSGRHGFVAVADAGSTGRYSGGTSPVRHTVIR